MRYRWVWGDSAYTKCDHVMGWLTEVGFPEETGEAVGARRSPD
jgi:hypothetical protein